MDYFCGNKNEKSLYFNINPIVLEESKLGVEVYRSEEFITNFYCQVINYKFIGYVFDKTGYVKEMNYQYNGTTNKNELEIVSEYFIDKKYSSTHRNQILDRMLYGKGLEFNLEL